MAIFDPATILSVFNDRGTLLLFLKAIEKKLEDLSITAEDITSPVEAGNRYLMADGRGGCYWNAPPIGTFYLLQFDIPYAPGPGDTHLTSAVLPNGKTVLTVYANGYAEADLRVSYDAVGSGKLYFTGFRYDAEAGEFYYTSCRAVYTAWDASTDPYSSSFQSYIKTFPEGSPPDITISEYDL